MVGKAPLMPSLQEQYDTRNIRKPRYSIPSMAEIEATPAKHLAVSTFSGCGGSCLGYRMAGFNVAWASEFIEAAQQTYVLNHPGAHLDTRDIREVKGRDILRKIGARKGEIDLFDGSPPCAAFSSSGKLEKGWNQPKKYSDKVQRVDDLFYEYVRLVSETQPKVFVAENVTGLVRGVAKGYFKNIFRAMAEAGYIVRAQIIDGQWLGIPQQRKRLIFIGVRKDLKQEPVFPEPLPYRYSVADVLPWIRRFRISGAPNRWKTAQSPYSTITQSVAMRAWSSYLAANGYVEAMAWVPEPTEPASDSVIDLWDATGYRVGQMIDQLEEGDALRRTRYYQVIDNPYRERRKLFIPEVKALSGFPQQFHLTGTFAQRWERIGRAVPPPMMEAIARAVRTHILD